MLTVNVTGEINKKMAATYNTNGNDTVAARDHESNSAEKKYGEIMPKKKPLISKNHERAFFDSADWALCKRTPHQQLPPRRPACSSGRDGLISSSN
ncbi:hypothetical protein DCAR_0101696 [Daucus carota subsp. sativus]|uniref:cAMP-regulated phosphoprotein 19-related protein n=1 Tax=Daucus carota subsp. sativus TaxID=79200 RepID=A0AAF1AJI2_DAUCS|nr:hypothetical protein DCAR_0101696 [Daucus carota subsp. sativus]